MKSKSAEWKPIIHWLQRGPWSMVLMANACFCWCPTGMWHMKMVYHSCTAGMKILLWKAAEKWHITRVSTTSSTDSCTELWPFRLWWPKSRMRRQNRKGESVHSVCSTGLKDLTKPNSSTDQPNNSTNVYFDLVMVLAGITKVHKDQKHLQRIAC